LFKNCVTGSALAPAGHSFVQPDPLSYLRSEINAISSKRTKSQPCF